MTMAMTPRHRRDDRTVLDQRQPKGYRVEVLGIGAARGCWYRRWSIRAVMCDCGSMTILADADGRVQDERMLDVLLVPTIARDA